MNVIGSFYAVTPGQGSGPEFFPLTLDGLCGKAGARSRAAWLSKDGSAQAVTKTEGRATTVICTWQDGREVFRAGAELVPAGPPPEPVAEVIALAGRQPGPRPQRPRPHRRRRERVSWPGLDLNHSVN